MSGKFWEPIVKFRVNHYFVHAARETSMRPFFSLSLFFLNIVLTIINQNLPAIQYPNFITKYDKAADIRLASTCK